MSDILASPSDMPRGVRGVAPPEENCPISLPLHRTCPGGYGGSPPRKKTVRYLGHPSDPPPGVRGPVGWGGSPMREFRPPEDNWHCSTYGSRAQAARPTG